METRANNARHYQTTAVIALILAAVALIAAIVAINLANDATHRLSGQDTKLNQLNKEVKLLDRPASTGAGVGPNSGTQTVVPTGSGE